MTMIDMTGMVLKIVTIGCQNVATFLLNPDHIPNIKPNKNANNNAIRSLTKVINITKRDFHVVNRPKKAFNTSKGLGSSKGFETTAYPITHTMNIVNIERIVIPVFFKSITYLDHNRNYRLA